MPLGFPNIGNAAAVVGQTSRSARVLQDPLFAQRNQPCPSTNRPTWTQLAQTGKNKWYCAILRAASPLMGTHALRPTTCPQERTRHVENVRHLRRGACKAVGLDPEAKAERVTIHPCTNDRTGPRGGRALDCGHRRAERAALRRVEGGRCMSQWPSTKVLRVSATLVRIGRRMYEPQLPVGFLPPRGKVFMVSDNTW